jgi:hypothetical protein
MSIIVTPLAIEPVSALGLDLMINSAHAGLASARSFDRGSSGSVQFWPRHT